MCELVENYAKERAQEAATDSAKRLFENGASYELVRASLTTLSDAELKSINEKVKGKNL